MGLRFRRGAGGAGHDAVKMTGYGAISGALLGLGLLSLFGPSPSADPSQSAAMLAQRLITLAAEERGAPDQPEVVVLGEAPDDDAEAPTPEANGASVATLAALEISQTEGGLPAPPMPEPAVIEPPQAPPPAAPARSLTPARPLTKARIIAVDKGDTLMKVLVKAGAERGQAYDAIGALSKVFNPRKLKAGQEVTLTFRMPEDGRAAPVLIGVGVAASDERELLARRGDDGKFAPEELRREFERRIVRSSGTIKSSLYLAATRVKLPMNVLMEMIRIFSWDVDFQRDIQPGDRFDVVFESLFDAHGRPVRAGRVLRAALTLSGVDLAYYRYTPSDDEIADYFDAKGHSVRKALLRTPIDGARLTSRYGKRKHPILGYTRHHPGVDFGAPKGTPIYAAGDGKVEAAGWEGNYGRYVRLRHKRELQTAYARTELMLVQTLLGILASEWDSGAQRLVDDNAALRELALRGAEALDSADASLAGELRSLAGEADPSLRLSDLSAANGRLRGAIGRLGALLEDADTPVLAELRAAVIEHLRADAESRSRSLLGPRADG